VNSVLKTLSLPCVTFCGLGYDSMSWDLTNSLPFLGSQFNVWNSFSVVRVFRAVALTVTWISQVLIQSNSVSETPYYIWLKGEQINRS
jgi:hypothetical protein